VPKGAIRGRSVAGLAPGKVSRFVGRGMMVPVAGCPGPGQFLRRKTRECRRREIRKTGVPFIFACTCPCFFRIGHCIVAICGYFRVRRRGKIADWGM